MKTIVLLGMILGLLFSVGTNLLVNAEEPRAGSSPAEVNQDSDFFPTHPAPENLLEIEPSTQSVQAAVPSSVESTSTAQAKNIKAVNPKPTSTDTIIRQKIAIVSQIDNHELITVGDEVYLKTKHLAGLDFHRRYTIYKEVVKAMPAISKQPVHLEQVVGQLKLLDKRQPLSLARITTASDIIKPGDFIYIGQ